jgi:hypothetical protein
VACGFAVGQAASPSGEPLRRRASFFIVGCTDNGIVVLGGAILDAEDAARAEELAPAGEAREAVAYNPSAATPMVAGIPAVATDRAPVPRLTFGLLVARTSPQGPAAALSPP